MWRSLRRWLAIGYLHVRSWLAPRKPYGVLTLSLDGELAEDTGESRFLGLFRRPPTDYLGVLTVLRWARDDQQLQGVLLRVDDLHASWARIQGLRRAIERLRAAGKRVWVHLERAGMGEYYLASAADRVLCAPAATLDVTGLASEAMFVRDTLDKVGIDAEVVHVGRYKSAGEMVTRTSMSEAHREMLEALVEDLFGQIADGVAAGRALDAALVRDALGRGPYVAAEAQAARLIDGTAYADEAERQLADACGGAAVIERDPYLARRGRAVRLDALRRARHTVALVHIGGTIKPGESVSRPAGGGAAGVRSIAAVLKRVRERDDIAALVLRIASPGGSALASDLIWREVERTRAAKPVIATCGDVAASGGYYVALAGRPLLAEAGTITGSIGVVAGKATLRRLYDRLGVHKETVARGRHATLFSDYVALDDDGRERIQHQAESFYRDFVGKVAAARGLSPEAAEAAAQGRVWTGRQAQARGLVDELGGLEEALDAAKRAIGVAVDQPVLVERVTRPRRLGDLSLGLRLPRRTGIADLFDILPSLRFLLRERVWAVMPFDIRFF
ncbi:signal peptide peptidase SppA [bacterium]|nr:signal peptide peptidase SppA [bacterium]